MVSGLGLQFSYEKQGFKTRFFIGKVNSPVKSKGFKTMFFYMFFTWPLKGLHKALKGPLRAL